MELLDVHLEYNPNNNYDVLHDLLCALKRKHFPNKKIKINTNTRVRHGLQQVFASQSNSKIKYTWLSGEHHMNLLITMQL